MQECIGGTMVKVSDLIEWRDRVKDELNKALDSELFDEADSWLEVYKIITIRLNKFRLNRG
jgi:hypothetical protein